MRENVTISYRGANYEIGRGKDFYGIWVAGAADSQPSEQWPDTPEGWHGAWTRFTGIEMPGTIVPAGQDGRKPIAAPKSSVIAASLLGLGVVLGVVGLFPDYLGGTSLAQQPADAVAHSIYLAVWTASALLIVLGGARLRVGALLGLGMSAVTFGLFFADAGTPIAGGAHLMGAGLILGLLGWLACTAGGALALRGQSAGAPASPATTHDGSFPGADTRCVGGRGFVRPVVGQLHPADIGRGHELADRGERVLQSRGRDRR